MKKNQYRLLEWQDVHYLQYDFNIYIYAMQINTQLTRLEMPIRRYFIDLNKMPCKCLLHRGISRYAHNL